jgi:hypothetical protein
MAYKIAFEPLNRIRGVEPTTVTKETATEAWRAVEGLMRSDERVTINDGMMSWQRLKQLAEDEAAGQKG